MRNCASLAHDEIQRTPRTIKTLILFSVDAVLASTAYWLATIARFGRIPSVSLEHVITGTALAAILMPTVALALGFYKSVTRFETLDLASHAGKLSRQDRVFMNQFMLSAIAEKASAAPASPENARTDRCRALRAAQSGGRCG